MQKLHRGVFLTLEGGEGVGKTTAVKFIQNYLQKAEQEFVITREPGGTPCAEQMRQLLLAPNLTEVITPTTELLLMFASRSQHIENLIKPALATDKFVVSDRFVDASYAYQGGGRGFDTDQITTLDKWIVGDLRPDVTILLDAPPSLGMARAKKRGTHDRIEQEKLAFFERVRAVYLARAAADKKRFQIIDATKPLAAVQAEIQTILDKLLLERSGDN
jgi:dTMP kinase